MLFRVFLIISFAMSIGIAINSQLASGAPADRPNILFAISDDQSFPHASAYGCEFVKTPGFDRVARMGVLFHNAFTASPGCSPSRASILTGRYPWQNEHAGTHASSFDQSLKTYPALLAQSGYHVGFTGKGWGPGNWRVGGFAHNPAGVGYSAKYSSRPPKGISANNYAAAFEKFLDARDADAPFCFWYGASEPHRTFEKGIGAANGDPSKVEVPRFLPDVPEIRNDLLDYAFEIEWFDRHLLEMIEALEDRGLLENTIIVVTSDNGMAFPRAKANCYELGIHMPLAICWPQVCSAGRSCEDVVSLVDLMPTFLQAAGLEISDPDISGKSLMGILQSDQSGRIEPARTQVFSARERHSSSRWNNFGYPQRCLRTDRYLYIRNFRPERWPAGAPQKFGQGGYAKSHAAEKKLGPMFAGFHDIDACPTWTWMIEHRDDPKIGRLFHLSVDHRPAEELYDIVDDRDCLRNLAVLPDFQETLAELREQLQDMLEKTGDPRATGNGDVFATYRRYSPIRHFPKPGWAR